MVEIKVDWEVPYREDQMQEKIKHFADTFNSLPGYKNVWFADLAIYLPYDFDPSHPSVRLRRLNIRKPLRETKVKADVIYRFEDLLPYTDILISHYSAEVVNEIIHLKKLGKRIWYDHTEDLWGFPYQEQVFNLCDYIVCCSHRLAENTQARLTSHTRCIVIEDMCEGPVPRHTPKPIDRPRVVWVGMGGNSYLAKEKKSMIEDLGMDLVIISEHADADIPWHRDTYLQHMAEADIAICPQNVTLQPAKSNVKLVTAMGVGLPVIASPNPAYIQIVQQGVNGYIALTSEEWAIFLEKLKDYETRKLISEAALRTASYYTPQAIAKNWCWHLSMPRHRVALINNTLKQKYLSYGDYILDNLRIDGLSVECFRYEDVDNLPKGYDLYLFVEVRYDPKNIQMANSILITQEEQTPEILSAFGCIVTTQQLAEKWSHQQIIPVADVSQIRKEHLDKYLTKL